MIRNNDKAYKIAMTGLMAALSYVVFTFGQIKLTLPGGDTTSIHLGNAVCVLGALLIGGFWGGLGARAIAVLKELSGGKRMIGIISHVAELREQIEKKITVKRGEEGSLVRVETE